VADPGISKREGAVVTRGLKSCLLKAPSVKDKAMVGVQGAKPPEDDEFSQVKGVFFFEFKIMMTYEIFFYDFKPGAARPARRCWTRF
jgi:hypothetical protein